MGIRERFSGMAHGRRVAVAAASAVLVAGLGVGGAYAATAGLRARAGEVSATKASAATQASAEPDESEAAYVIEIGVTAEGWDAEGSSPVIAHVTGADGTVDFYHAYDANEAEELGVDEAGTYKVSFISPVNADGSIYKVGGAVSVEAKAEASGEEDATTGGADATTTEAATTGAAAGTTTVATFERVDAKDVTADDLNKVAEQVAEAVKKGDGTLSGEAGAAVAQKVADNAKANPNADAAKVEETAKEAESTAKEGKSEAKAPAATTTAAKKASSSGSSSGSTSGSSSASSSTSSPASANKGSSGSGSSSSSSSSGSQQASTPQRRWVAEQGHWETTYEQVWVSKIVYTTHEAWECSQCGATYEGDNAKAELSAHVKSTYKSESHPNGASAINVSYDTSEDQGHWESQATGQTWVVDVPAHWE